MINSKRIFISYGHDEFSELALQLKEDLTGCGHEVWFDLERLKSGQDWEAYIEEGLDWVSEIPNAGRVVLMMTPHSVRRPDGYCLNEIARAIQHRVNIVPVMVVWCEPPLSICRIQWLDMRDCVPVAAQSDRYKLKFDFLIEALEEDKIDVEFTQSRLLEILKPLDFSADIAQHVPNFTGRQWVFKHLDNWLGSPDASRVFWITGAPGVGKTAIAAYLCHKRREVAAFHLCRYGHDDKSDPRRCVMSIAYQLSTQLPDYQKRLVAMDLLEEVKKSALTIFDNLIVQPLAPPFPEPNRIILIVLDALDEATYSGKNELAEFIAKEFPRTPTWLRLIITSRKEPEVVQPLQGLSPYWIDTALPENLEDIRTYIQDNLSASLHDQTLKKEITNTILEKSDGVFLYVEQIFTDLKKGYLSIERIEQFPKGLGGIFLRFFSRQFPDSKIYKQHCHPLIETIIAAKSPLPVNLAKTALRCNDYDCQDALARLGSLFPVVDGHIRPFHQSLVDWLTTPDLAGAYYINIHEGQRRLTDICWVEYQAGVKEMSVYGLVHLPVHLMELDRWKDLLALVSCPELGLIARWIEEGEGDKGIICLTGLINYLESTKGDPINSAGLATQVARIYSTRGQYDDAQNWLKHALKKTSWWKGRRVRVVAFHELGSLHLYHRSFKNSTRFYRNALRLCRWGIPIYHDELAANLIGLSTVAHVTYRFTDAMRFATWARREAEQAEDYSHIISAERLLGATCKTIGRYEEADMHFQTALSLCDKYRVYTEKARLFLLIGCLKYDYCTLNKKLPVEAEYFFDEAMTLAQHLNDFYHLTEAKLNLGACALAKGADASSWFEPLKTSLPREVHSELQIKLELGLAGVVYQQGDLETAGNLFQEIISSSRKHDLRHGLRIALVGLGAVHWHSDRAEEAEKYWQQAIKVANEVSDARRILTEISIQLCKNSPGVTPR